MYMDFRETPLSFHNEHIHRIKSLASEMVQDLRQKSLP